VQLSLLIEADSGGPLRTSHFNFSNGLWFHGSTGRLTRGSLLPVLATQSN